MSRFAEFRRRYLEELDQPSARQARDHILAVARSRRVVLLTATRNVEHCAAQVLSDSLQR